MIVYLASDFGLYVSGQVIAVDANTKTTLAGPFDPGQVTKSWWPVEASTLP